MLKPYHQTIHSNTKIIVFICNDVIVDELTHDVVNEFTQDIMNDIVFRMRFFLLKSSHKYYYNFSLYDEMLIRNNLLYVPDSYSRD